MSKAKIETPRPHSSHYLEPLLSSPVFFLFLHKFFDSPVQYLCAPTSFNESMIVLENATLVTHE